MKKGDFVLHRGKPAIITYDGIVDINDNSELFEIQEFGRYNGIIASSHNLKPGDIMEAVLNDLRDMLVQYNVVARSFPELENTMTKLFEVIHNARTDNATV